MGFATSTPLVDHEPGAGVYVGIGRLGRVLTSLTPVIFSLLFSAWKGSAGRAGSAAARSPGAKSLYDPSLSSLCFHAILFNCFFIDVESDARVRRGKKIAIFETEHCFAFQNLQSGRPLLFRQ